MADSSNPAPATPVENINISETKTTDNTKAPVVEEKTGRFDKTFEEKEKPKHALVDMSTIELKAEDLYDKDKVDLEQVELDDIWILLQ